MAQIILRLLEKLMLYGELILQRRQPADVPNPPAGFISLFANDVDNKLYAKKSDGTIVDLESGGGGSGGGGYTTVQDEGTALPQRSTLNIRRPLKAVDDNVNLRTDVKFQDGNFVGQVHRWNGTTWAIAQLSRGDIPDFWNAPFRPNIPDFAHAASHQHGGNDEIATATPAANAIPKALANGKLDSGWISDNLRTVSVGITVGDGVNVITTGVKGAIWVPVSGTITEWTILSTDAGTPTTGSIEFDILKSTYANYPNMSSIVGTGTKPNISNSVKGNGTPTGWTTTTINAGDCLRFDVTSVSGLKRVTLVLKVVKS